MQPLSSDERFLDILSDHLSRPHHNPRMYKHQLD